MARGAAVTAQRDDHDAQQGDPKTSKRRCIQSACVPCRRRKSKVSCLLPVVPGLTHHPPPHDPSTLSADACTLIYPLFCPLSSPLANTPGANI
jgi:hypothetical protein